MDLIDSHAHVDVSDFDADRDAMLERAQDGGRRDAAGDRQRA